ncbi:hypothetical protein F5888DRAFT_1640084 [Russula emetica]|nr:hypothetical protein F5888DRAFT_1640084 [Russula emetica]
MQSISSLEAVLTDEQISTLNGHVNEFEAADYKVREEITEDFLGSFKSACPKGVKFDEVTIGTLIHQHLYGTKSAPKTQSRVVEESQEIVLTDQHIRMLERCLPKFRGADPKSREKMVKEAADHIKSAWTGGTEFDRDTVISLIRQHLYGRARWKLKKSAFETRKWTYLDVVMDMNRNKIHELALEFPKNTPGSADYLSNYNKARRLVEQKYKAMAKEWMEKKLPPGMQQRMMAKHRPRAMREFTSSVYHQFGMRIVVLAAYIDADGDSSMTLFDYNEQNGGISFKLCHKNWRQYEMVDDFSKWGTDSFGATSTDGSEDESARKKKSPEIEIKLKRNKDGYPILPSLQEISHHGLTYKKRLIGKFMGDVYRS